MGRRSKRYHCSGYSGVAKKGRLVAISGRIRTRSWDDQGGTRRYATEVIADEVNYLDKPKDNGQANGIGEDTGDFHPYEVEDDLPFN